MEKKNRNKRRLAGKGLAGKGKQNDAPKAIITPIRKLTPIEK